MYLHFSDEKKRQLYDEYGSFGLYIADQVGDEFVGSVMMVQSGWFKVRIMSVCIDSKLSHSMGPRVVSNVDNAEHSVLTHDMSKQWKNGRGLFWCHLWRSGGQNQEAVQGPESGEWEHAALQASCSIWLQWPRLWAVREAEAIVSTQRPSEAGLRILASLSPPSRNHLRI